MINHQLIIYFTVKKYKKKNGYAAATKDLCLYLHVLPLIAVIAQLSRNIVFSHSFSYYFTNNASILMWFVSSLFQTTSLFVSKFKKEKNLGEG